MKNVLLQFEHRKTVERMLNKISESEVNQKLLEEIDKMLVTRYVLTAKEVIEEKKAKLKEGTLTAYELAVAEEKKRVTADVKATGEVFVPEASRKKKSAERRFEAGKFGITYERAVKSKSLKKTFAKSKIFPSFDIQKQKEAGVNSGALFLKVHAWETLATFPPLNIEEDFTNESNYYGDVRDYKGLFVNEELCKIFTQILQDLKEGLEPLKEVEEVKEFLKRFVASVVFYEYFFSYKDDKFPLPWVDGNYYNPKFEIERFTDESTGSTRRSLQTGKISVLGKEYDVEFSSESGWGASIANIIWNAIESEIRKDAAKATEMDKDKFKFLEYAYPYFEQIDSEIYSIAFPHLLRKMIFPENLMNPCKWGFGGRRYHNDIHDYVDELDEMNPFLVYSDHSRITGRMKNLVAKVLGPNFVILCDCIGSFDFPVEPNYGTRSGQRSSWRAYEKEVSTQITILKFAENFDGVSEEKVRIYLDELNELNLSRLFEIGTEFDIDETKNDSEFVADKEYYAMYSTCQRIEKCMLRCWQLDNEQALPDNQKFREPDWSWAETAGGRTRRSKTLDIMRAKVGKKLKFLKRTGCFVAPNIPMGANYKQELAKNLGLIAVSTGKNSYMSRTETKDHGDRFMEAAIDLFAALGMDFKYILGNLILMLGAGGAGATAIATYHRDLNDEGKFERSINITKSRGDGSVAHEMFHFLDNLFTKNPLDPDAYMSENTEMMETNQDKIFLIELQEEVRKLNSKMKKSNFYYRCEKEDNRKSKIYWTKTREMWARCFEVYIWNKMKSIGMENNYLVKYYDESVYPNNMENSVFSASFDTIFDLMKKYYSIPSFTPVIDAKDVDKQVDYELTDEEKAADAEIDSLGEDSSDSDDKTEEKEEEEGETKKGLTFDSLPDIHTLTYPKFKAISSRIKTVKKESWGNKTIADELRDVRNSNSQDIWKRNQAEEWLESIKDVDKYSSGETTPDGQRMKAHRAGIERAIYENKDIDTKVFFEGIQGDRYGKYLELYQRYRKTKRSARSETPRELSNYWFNVDRSMGNLHNMGVSLKSLAPKLHENTLNSSEIIMKMVEDNDNETKFVIAEVARDGAKFLLDNQNKIGREANMSNIQIGRALKKVGKRYIVYRYDRETWSANFICFNMTDDAEKGIYQELPPVKTLLEYFTLNIIPEVYGSEIKSNSKINPSEIEATNIFTTIKEIPELTPKIEEAIFKAVGDNEFVNYIEMILEASRKGKIRYKNILWENIYAATAIYLRDVSKIDDNEIMEISKELAHTVTSGVVSDFFEMNGRGTKGEGKEKDFIPRKKTSINVLNGLKFESIKKDLQEYLNRTTEQKWSTRKALLYLMKNLPETATNRTATLRLIELMVMKFPNVEGD